MDSKYFAMQGGKLGSVHAVDGTAKTSISMVRWEWDIPSFNGRGSFTQNILWSFFHLNCNCYLGVSIPQFFDVPVSEMIALACGFLWIWVHGLLIHLIPRDTVEQFQKWMGKTTVYRSMSRKNQKDYFRLLALCRRTPERAFFDAEHIQIWLVGKNGISVGFWQTG